MSDCICVSKETCKLTGAVENVYKRVQLSLSLCCRFSYLALVDGSGGWA